MIAAWRDRTRRIERLEHEAESLRSDLAALSARLSAAEEMKVSLATLEAAIGTIGETLALLDGRIGDLAEIDRDRAEAAARLRTELARIDLQVSANAEEANRIGRGLLDRMEHSGR